MMKLADIRDYVAKLGIVKNERCYMGKMDTKHEESIGCYHLRRSGSPRIPLGGQENMTFDVLPVSFLIHWNKNAAQTDQKANELYRILQDLRDITVNNKQIKFCIMQVPYPQDVGTDESGIFEMVIEAEFYCSKEVKEEK